LDRNGAIGECDLQEGVVFPYCQSIGSIVPPSYLSEVEVCRGVKWEKLVSVEDEEGAVVADDEGVGFGRVERQLRGATEYLPDFGEREGSHCQAAVKNN